MLTLISATGRVAAVGAIAALMSFLLGAGGSHTGAPKSEGTIAFVRWSAAGLDPTLDLFVIHADGTGLRRLTGRGSDSAHRWSPDGSLIAYTNRGSLWLIHPDGMGRVRLVSRN